MTAAVWVIGMSAILAVGLVYLIGDARGHARGYAVGRRDGRRAVYQLHRDGTCKRARAAEETIEHLYDRARNQIRQHDSNGSGGGHE